MELQGTVKPSGVTSEVGFKFKREKWRKSFKKKGNGAWTTYGTPYIPWYPDDSDGDFQDTTPSGTNHIYDTDAPGIGYKDCTPDHDHRAYIGDFKQWVNVQIDSTWYQCSKFYKWHSQIYTEPKNANEMTRDSLSLQKLGSGWITVPDSL